MSNMDQREPAGHNDSQRSYIVELMSPTFLLILIPSLIFLAEVMVMILLSFLPRMSLVNEALLDASMLILLVVPVLYFLILKPVRLYINKQRITAREQKELSDKLEDALNEVRTLQKMLPVCGKCKKIRDDREYFMEIEKYIQAHPQCELTGTLCSECDKGSFELA